MERLIEDMKGDSGSYEVELRAVIKAISLNIRAGDGSLLEKLLSIPGIPTNRAESLKILLNGHIRKNAVLLGANYYWTGLTSRL